jgi:ribosomal protein L5
MSNLKNDYLNSVIPKLKEEFKYNNIHQIPKIEKINVRKRWKLNDVKKNFSKFYIKSIKYFVCG